LASLRAGRIVYHADRMAECLAGLPDPTCTISGLLDDDVACAAAFEGVVPPGGACIANVECRSGTCQSEICSGTCCAGSCAPSPARNVEPGERCRSGGDCVAGSVCGRSATCEVMVGEGEACPDGTVCSGFLTCVGG